MRQIDKSRNYEYTQKAAHCRKMRMRSRLPHGIRRTMHTYDTLQKIEKIKMAESIRDMSSEMGDNHHNHGNFDLFNDQDVFEGVIFYYRRFDWKILRLLNWIRVYAEKLVNAPKSHKIVYAPMHTIWVITRLGA